MTRTVTVAGDFPDPAMQPMPFRVGLYLDDDVTGHVYRTDSTEGPRGRVWHWELHVGAAHQALFQRLAAGMFNETLLVEQASAPPGACLDAVLQPSIEDFSFANSAQARHREYEVWIRYRMRQYTADGRLVSEWTVSGYGQKSQGAFGGAEETAHAAVVEAMRDAAADLISGFLERAVVSAILDNGPCLLSPATREPDAGSAGEASYVP